jgi:hypothetical protein
VGRWWFYVGASAVFGTILSWLVVFRPMFGRSNAAALPFAASKVRQLALTACIALLVGTL